MPPQHAAGRHLRPHARQPAHQRHGPLQHPLLLLHAGDGRAVRAARRACSSFEEIERFVRVAVQPGRSQDPSHRRRAAAPPGTARPDRAARRHSRHRRSRAHHQRRAAGRPGGRRCTMPGCAASTCTWTRSTASASSRSPGATIWTACWRASRRRRRLGYGPVKINAVAVKDLVEPDIVPLARFGRENAASRSATSSSCRSTRKDLWDRERCCWRTT